MKICALLLCLLTAFTDAFSQEDHLRAALTQTVLSEVLPQPARPRRKMLDLGDAKLSTRLNPLTYLAAGMMFTYQNVVSEQIAANCAYHISCSEFTKRSIERHGLIKGTLIGLHQLTNCFPGAKYDHCEHAVSNENKILNRVE